MTSIWARVNVLTKVTPCDKRGILAELPATGLVVASVFWISSHTMPEAAAIEEFTRALVPEGVEAFSSIAVLWRWFTFVVIGCVSLLFIRLYASLSVFDHDRKACAAWIWPLRPRWRPVEVAFRLFVVCYIVLQVHDAVKGSLHPWLISASSAFFSEPLGSPQSISTGMVEAIKGATFSPSQPFPEFIIAAGEQTHNVVSLLDVIIELMVWSLIWDIVLLARQPGQRGIYGQWVLRFAAAHVFAIVYCFACLVCVSFMVQGKPELFYITFLIFLFVFAAWFVFALPIFFMWIRYLFTRLAFYFSKQAAACHSDP